MIAKIGIAICLLISQGSLMAAAVPPSAGDANTILVTDVPDTPPKALPLTGMNAGLNDAWYNAETSGQGFFITVFPNIGHVSLSWFTYDTQRPDDEGSTGFGESAHRWLTTLGAYSGNQAVMNVTSTFGGLFDTPTDTTQVSAGTVVLTFEDCKSGTVTYDIPSINKKGVVPIQRTADDNIALCEALNTLTSSCDISSPNLSCDLLGYWRFEEPVYFGRKNGVLDASLTGHHATPVNGVARTTTGKLGKALTFNGTSEYLTVDHRGLKTVPSGSVALWVRTDVSNHLDRYQTLMHNGSDSPLILDISESGQIRFSLDTDTKTHTLLSGPGNNDGKWHHVAATWGSNGLHLFIDGQPAASNDDAASRTTTPDAWYIGAANAGLTGVFEGELDEAALWKRPLTMAEVQALYNSGQGYVISAGPEIAQFQPKKMIYQPSDLVSFDLTIDSDKTYSNVTVEVWVEREVNTQIHVYRQTHQIGPGTQNIKINWPLSDNGLNNNVNGHLARVTLRDSTGRIIAEKEALFDIVDNWWKVMRLAVQGASTFASPGAPSPVGRLSDSSIENRVDVMQQWGFNTFEAYHYSPPWNLDPEGDTWEDIDYAGRYISRNRLVKWGSVLHDRGMKYLGYNEIAAIEGPPEWQVRWKTNGRVWQKYYADKGYFTPNINFLSQRWADENLAAIDAFDFDGILMDSAYNMGDSTVNKLNDNNGKPLPQAPSVGQYMHDGFGPAKTALLAAKDAYAYVSQNAYPLVFPALSVPLGAVYDKVLSEANEQDVWPYNADVDIWSIEWDPKNTPSKSYPQEYERMAVLMTSLVEVLGKPVLQWAFLTSQSRSDIAYIRPKFATYLAARLKVHDHQNLYEGLLGPETQNEPDSLQFAQYLRFQARYSYYLDHPDLKLVQQPQNAHFTVTASKDLFWKRTVYHRFVNEKNEYTINALNLPSNGRIEGQTEIPSTAEDVVLGIRKSIGNFDVFSLDADDATLAPIEISMDSEDTSFRYFTLPPIRSWQVLVLKEK